jgi:hypothetical protein
MKVCGALTHEGGLGLALPCAVSMYHDLHLHLHLAKVICGGSVMCTFSTKGQQETRTLPGRPCPQSNQPPCLILALEISPPPTHTRLPPHSPPHH